MSHATTRAAVLVLLLAGCPTTPGEPDEPPRALLEVEPGVVDFGEVYAGGAPATRVVRIRNAGDAPLTLAEPHLEGPFGSDPSSIGPLEPGREALLQLTWTPLQDGPVEGLLTVSSIAPPGLSETVPLSGDGMAPRLVLEPASHDFGAVQPGCHVGLEVTIRNGGRAPLRVYDIRYEDVGGADDLFISNGNPGDGDPSTIDFELNTGEETRLEVHYTPADLEPDSGVLTVLTNTPGEPEDGATAQQSGTPEVTTWETETFIQSLIEAADVLLVVDDSVSMAEEEATVLANLSALFAGLQASGVDYQVAVTTTNSSTPGELSGDGFITPATPDAAAAFSTAVQVGATATTPEVGLHSAWVALEAARDGVGHHAGFLRQDATLQLLFVSDSRDESAGVLGWGWDSYVNFYLYGGYEPLVSMIGLAEVSGGPTGCSGAGGSASPNPDYAAAAAAMGGVSASICEPDWADDLAPWLDSLPYLADRFQLASIPVLATIEVSVGGLPTSDWTWESWTNAIVLPPDQVPQEGETVEVVYGVADDCTD